MNDLAIMSKAMLQERKDIIFSILGGFIAGIAGVALFSASGYMISQTVFAPQLYTLIIITSMVKLLGLLRAASRYGERLYSHRATFSILSRLRVTFFARLIPITPGILNKNRSGDLLARIVGDVESLQHYFLRVAYPPMIALLVFLATMVFTSAFSIWIACVLVVGMLLTAVIVPCIVLIGQRKINGRVREQRALLSTEVTEVLYGFRDLKIYGQLPEREQQLGQAAVTLTKEQQKAADNLLRGQSMHTFVTFFISWSVLAVGAWLIIEGTLNGVFLAMLIMASMTVFEEVAAMATLPVYKQDSEHAAASLHETVGSTDIESVQSSKVLSNNQAISIDIDQVTFQYEDEWRPALQELSLHLSAGSKTAIVGASGSGKSTIIDLLLKLRVPTKGSIKLNNMSVQELDEQSIWQTTNVVLQQGHFFRGTIRDNLLLNHEQYSDEQLVEVLNQMQLPQLRLTDMVYEKGENLSDGEKQRLALARAMLRKGRLWLLDEPTSSLDYVTEQRVLQQLLNRATEDTLLLIGHRLTGLEKMDQIVVMDQGKIVESGSYSELMDRQGYFYEMKKIEWQMIGEAAI